MTVLVDVVNPLAGVTRGHTTVRLPGGGAVALRPLRCGEREPLLSVFDGMSSRSRARRYLTGIGQLSPRMVDLLSDVDGRRHVAWLASHEGRAIGVARYVLVDPGVAEIAFEVVDAHHGAGIASALVDAVTTVAAAQGVRRIRASLFPENEASWRLVTRIGVQLNAVGGLLEGEGRLRLLDPPRVDRESVLALARHTADLRGTTSPHPPRHDSTRSQRPGRTLSSHAEDLSR